MENQIYELYLRLGRYLTKKDIDNCDSLPSYNTICRMGFKIRELNKKFYSLNAFKCKECSSPIEYDKKYSNLFCSRTCSVRFNNKSKNKNIINCLSCNNQIIPYKKNRKYCSNSCQHEYQYNLVVCELIKGNTYNTSDCKNISNHIRRYLYESRGDGCEVCGWDERHPIDGNRLTEIDHIDGDAENNKLSNLRILCPNHHAMTNTYRARNKKSSRNRK